MFKSVRVDAICADEHEVVVEEGRGIGGDFECLIAAGSRDDGVGRSDGGDDVLDDTLSERPGNTLNIELLCTLQSRLVEPVNMIGVIVVDLLVCGGV